MAYYTEPICDNRYIPRLTWEEIPEGYYDTDWWRGEKISKKRLPTRARQLSSHKQLPHFFGVDTSPAVSETFKNIVEGLEPDVHQFFPFEVIGKAGKLLDRPFFQINVLSKIDAIIPEKSNVYWSLATTLGTYVLRQGSGPIQLTLRRDMIAGHHLWLADKQYSTSDMFFSDDLMNAVKAANIKGLHAHRLAEE